MPIYEFQCLNCGLRVEKLVQKMEKPPMCKDCGGPTHRVWSVPSVAQWKCSKGSL